METYGKQVAAHHILKAMAIFSMILIHAWSFSISHDEYEAFSQTWSIQGVEWLSGLFFWGLWIPALAGAGLRFRLEKQPAPATVVKESFQIGCWLLGLGVFSSVASDLFRVLPHWNPPLFLASCFLLFALLNKCFPKTYVWLSSIVFLALELLFQWRLIPSAHSNSVKILLEQVLLGTSGGWSLSPWLLAFIFGYQFVQVLLSREITEPVSKWARAALVLIAGVTLVAPQSLSFFKTSFFMRNGRIPFLVVVGIHALFALVFLQLVKCSRVEKWGKVHLIQCLSQGSLYIFIFHLLVVYLMLPFFRDLTVPMRLLLLPIALLGWSLFFGECVLSLKQKKISIKLTKTKRISFD